MESRVKTVLIFAGTTEGRELAESLSRSKISCHVCVATEYGQQVLKPSDYITVHSGRLDEEGMKQLFAKCGCDIVVDATHPYAKLATDTIRKSTENLNIQYMRLLRKNDATECGGNIFEYSSIEECIAALEKTAGNILLTTGSKQLKEFVDSESIKSRIVARVLPGIESIELCYAAGLEGKQIIAMQGPFSKEMNETLIRDYAIRHLVTKESGVTGGVDSKLAAAHDMGISVHMIKRPDNAETDGKEIGEVIADLERELGCSIATGEVKVSLVGIGPGSKKLLTGAAQSAIEGADYLFGAQRMLDSVDSKAIKYPYYMKKDILPVLAQLRKNICRDISVVILFSGDTGFYSGMPNMYDAIREETGYSVCVIPGISSVSILASRLGISWQDGRLLSTHGIDEKIWIPQLMDSIRHNEKTFFLTSGIKDINRIGRMLDGYEGEYAIYLGKHISYEDEEMLKLTAKECVELKEDGLYTGVIIVENPESRMIVPDLDDDFFVRGNVPMTKETVRKILICKLKLREKDVVYDIGGGTGSVSIQIAALSPGINVYSLECNAEAVELIKENSAKAGTKNVTVVQATAPEGLDELPRANACFIGGSKGNLRSILSTLNKINPKMRVVMNAVSMENICEMNKLLEEFKVENVSIEQVAVTNVKELGRYHMLNANNPVFIFAFNFAGVIE